ncbi:MAG: hypothetical protein FWF23_00105 [Alphaproteobacteria bacterium]|nr:hypothetical protein [Alphaproteobacteria bacterium]MCL2505293.1 hypothetical protein [Alphaproteobacteria bacterium]
MENGKWIWCVLTFVSIVSLAAPAPAAAQDVSMFFPVLPDNAQEYTEPKLIPVASNYDFNKSNLSKITRAVIAIPDETRNAGALKQLLAEFAGSLNNSALIISPQFMIPADLLQFDILSPEEKKYFAIWDISDWAYGNQSINSNAQSRLSDEDGTDFINQDMGNSSSISSFDVTDKLVLFLAQKDIFPNLNTIIIAGRGLGANFVQRYAMFTSIPEDSLLNGISIHFLALGASSYVYPTDYRPNLYKNSLVIEGASGNAAQCKEMNDYPFGMDNLNTYARKTGKNAARVNYGTRAVTYITAKGAEPVSDSSCAAMLQGASVFERADNYQKYLSSVYGALSDTNHVFNFVAGNNNALNLYGSNCAVSVMFGNGLCHNPHASDTEFDENLYQSDENSAIDEDIVTETSHTGTSGYLDGLDL